MKKQWWNDKVAYQIYPKSFYDTNGDGIGDLRGIIEKLDYLKELGIDLVWISPCYQSPLADQGYDISDYYQIDPRFGTMADMEELIAEAKKREISIVMDLVVNHCSDEHEWFKKACEDPDGEFGKYFYIRDWDGKHLPTNWRSYFGGPVWEPLPGHPDKIYLHVFHKKQPDLNWQNPALREEIYKMINWWLDKGIAGFRVDAIINIRKPETFVDYPADREDGLCSIVHMLNDATGIGEYLGEMRDKTFARYDAFTVGEVFDAKEDELRDFIGEHGYFSTMFDFSAHIFGSSIKGWYDQTMINPNHYRDCCFAAQKQVANVGLISNIIENHDEPRGVSRYIPEADLCPRSKKMLAGLYMFLKGVPFIFQGQEIGMENYPFSSIEEVDDISTIDQYNVSVAAGYSPEEAIKAVSFMSRDNARTPVQWSDEENAGFTSPDAKPWLHINPNYRTINVASQLDDPDSVWNFYRELIALRKNPSYKETFVYGACEPILPDEDRLMAYIRKAENEGAKPGHDILVLGNFRNEARVVTLPGAGEVPDAGRLPAELKILASNIHRKEAKISDGTLSLEGYELLICEI